MKTLDFRGFLLVSFVLGYFYFLYGQERGPVEATSNSDRDCQRQNGATA